MPAGASPSPLNPPPRLSLLALLVLSANLLGDAFAGALDPVTGGSEQK